MARLTDEMKELFLEQKMYSVATSSKSGIPNVVPIARAKLLDDETILLCEYMNKTITNLRENLSHPFQSGVPSWAFSLKELRRSWKAARSMRKVQPG